MAAGGSFQKRQKQAVRREKRQLKLHRRQGRQPAGNISPSVTKNEEPANSVDAGDSTSKSSPK
jgi:hypothetical protein